MTFSNSNILNIGFIMTFILIKVMLNMSSFHTSALDVKLYIFIIRIIRILFTEFRILLILRIGL